MKRSEQGFTLVEIMIVVAIIALLAAIAIPNVLRGRTSANESASIGNLRALVSSLEMARSVNQAYPNNVATAWTDTMYGAGGVPAGCAAGIAPTPDFGPPSFCNSMAGGATQATGVVQGYTYTYAGVAAGTTYTVLSIPTTVGTTGTRAFFVNESGLIRHCADVVANMTVANLTGENTIDVQPNLCNNSTAT